MVNNCGKNMMFRLDNHLRKAHGLETHTSMYADLMKQSEEHMYKNHFCKIPSMQEKCKDHANRLRQVERTRPEVSQSLYKPNGDLATSESRKETG